MCSRRLRKVIGVLIALVTPGLVCADWQWTKWGMTVEEVRTASGDKAVMGNDGKLHAAYSALGMEFTAGFQFVDGRLSGVELVLDSPNAQRCGELEASLKDVYGPTFQQDKFLGATGLQWRDSKAGNRVMLFTTDPPLVSHCTLSYKPMVDGTKSGL